MEKGSAHSNRQLAEPAGEREPYLQVHLSEEGNLIQQGGKEGESGEDLNLKEKIRQDPPPHGGGHMANSRNQWQKELIKEQSHNLTRRDWKGKLATVLGSCRPCWVFVLMLNAGEPLGWGLPSKGIA